MFEPFLDGRDQAKTVTSVVFLFNITKVGDRACKFAGLITVDIPEGIESISDAAFYSQLVDMLSVNA